MGNKDMTKEAKIEEIAAVKASPSGMLTQVASLNRGFTP